MARSKEEPLNFEELMDAYNSIADETPSHWVIPMSWKERLHYDKHPPSPEQIELLMRKRGAIEVTFHGIRRVRFSDKLIEMFKRMPEFQELQHLG